MTEEFISQHDTIMDCFNQTDMADNQLEVLEREFKVFHSVFAYIRVIVETYKVIKELHS